jgi:hypothetical protein
MVETIECGACPVFFFCVKDHPKEGKLNTTQILLELPCLERNDWSFGHPDQWPFRGISTKLSSFEIRGKDFLVFRKNGIGNFLGYLSKKHDKCNSFWELLSSDERRRNIANKELLIRRTRNEVCSIVDTYFLPPQHYSEWRDEKTQREPKKTFLMMMMCSTCVS